MMLYKNKDEDYGKYENSNKLSYDEFQKYIDATFPTSNIKFIEDILPKAQKVVQDTIKAVFSKLDPQRKQ